MEKALAAFFASMAFIIILLTLSVDLINKGISDPFYILKMSSFAAVVFGVIGFYLGRVFAQAKEVDDKSNKEIPHKDRELLIDDILVYDIGVANKKEQSLEEPTPPQT